MCRCRGAHIACTRTYIGQCARKKIRPRTYIWAGSRMPTRAYVRPGIVYMAGSERRNSVVVVFMGSQPAGSEQNEWSCSSGGLGRNRRWKRGLAYHRTKETALCSTGHVQNGGRVHCEGSGVPQNGGNGPPTVETGALLIGRVWRIAKRTKRTSYGRNGGPVDREGCGVTQNGRNGPPTV